MSALGEFEFLAKLRARTAAHRRVPVGIGDDAAVIQLPGGELGLLTVDMLQEGVDFLAPPATGRQVGRKALAVSLSDIAAMGGVAVAAVVAVALPRRHAARWADELQIGLEQIAAEFDVALAGGDTNSWDGPLVISTTVYGEMQGVPPVLRRGAQPGDAVFVTGALGGSLAGHHFEFTPRLAEARWLSSHARFRPTAMIDVSDGFARDLHQILRASGCGAVVEAARLPIRAAAQQGSDSRTPRERALSDGEDFELIFTLPPQAAAELETNPLPLPWQTPLTSVGWILDEPECWLVEEDGARRPLPPLGWEHAFAE